MRRRLRLLLLAAALPLVLVATANAVVVLDARGEAAGSLGAVPHAQAALVLGAQVKPRPRAVPRAPRRPPGDRLRRRPARLRALMGRLQLREALARVKVVADSVTGADPRFLRPEVPIGGDGRATWKPDGPA